MFSAIHATSNIPKKVTPTQIKSCAIEALLKPNSVETGTVITNGGFIFKSVKSEQKFVKT